MERLLDSFILILKVRTVNPLLLFTFVELNERDVV